MHYVRGRIDRMIVIADDVGYLKATKLPEVIGGELGRRFTGRPAPGAAAALQSPFGSRGDLACGRLTDRREDCGAQLGVRRGLVHERIVAIVGVPNEGRDRPWPRGSMRDDRS